MSEHRIFDTNHSYNNLPNQHPTHLLIWDAPNIDMGLGAILGGRGRELFPVEILLVPGLGVLGAFHGLPQLLVPMGEALLRGLQATAAPFQFGIRRRRRGLRPARRRPGPRGLLLGPLRRPAGLAGLPFRGRSLLLGLPCLSGGGLRRLLKRPGPSVLAVDQREDLEVAGRLSGPALHPMGAVHVAVAGDRA